MKVQLSQDLKNSRLLVEIRLLVRSQEEVRTMVLERHSVLWGGRQLGWIVSSAQWKAELGSNELGYLAEETSRPRGTAWLLLVPYS